MVKTPKSHESCHRQICCSSFKVKSKKRVSAITHTHIQAVVSMCVCVCVLDSSVLTSLLFFTWGSCCRVADVGGVSANTELSEGWSNRKSSSACHWPLAHLHSGRWESERLEFWLKTALSVSISQDLTPDQGFGLFLFSSWGSELGLKLFTLSRLQVSSRPSTGSPELPQQNAAVNFVISSSKRSDVVLLLYTVCASNPHSDRFYCSACYLTAHWISELHERFTAASKHQNELCKLFLFAGPLKRLFRVYFLFIIYHYNQLRLWKEGKQK